MGIRVKHHPWLIIQDYWDTNQQEDAEAIFSLGNGKMGHRGNLEEYFSGPSLRGTYIAGVYYPDKTRVGWWKIGYPDYFAKIINAPDWRGIKIKVNGVELDLAKVEISDFERVLDMKSGFLKKTYTATLADGKRLRVQSIRFLSIVNDEVGAIKYKIQPLNFDARLEILLDIEGRVKNRDANYGEVFWEEVEKGFDPYPYLVTKTKEALFLKEKGKQPPVFYVCNTIEAQFRLDDEKVSPLAAELTHTKYIGKIYNIDVPQGKWLTIYKYAAVVSSVFHSSGLMLKTKAFDNLTYALDKGFERLLEEHAKAWEEKWKDSDIVIEGDVAAQQGIRFNIFQLNQTYTGKYHNLNIGPKGFTGEKYGGVTYWDTEAFCLPFYMSTAPREVARNLLIYRYNHLEKAIENAQKLGFSGGAALYPMVTINGEECHNEWEITFEEIHRNGAIAYAIFNYIRYNDEPEYLAKYGLEVLIAISRFWAQRVNWSEEKQKYVMLGVTGPNEYENNVNNNWYTNYIATWTLRYTIEALSLVKERFPDAYRRIVEKTGFDEAKETKQWRDIIDNMFFPYDEKRRVFLQQEGYLDKELKPASAIPPGERPINQHWSWDRILRSCYIKQADVVQGLFFFEDEFDLDTIRRNFYFYEPMTVHESSLSPSVYSIVASKIGDENKAYQLYLRTARLDLDDYNKEVREGLHVTSMGGTWMSLVYGFGGMRIKQNRLSFAPFVPSKWKSFSFKVRFRDWLLKVYVDKHTVRIENQGDRAVELFVYDGLYTIEPQKTLEVEAQHSLRVLT